MGSFRVLYLGRGGSVGVGWSGCDTGDGERKRVRMSPILFQGEQR